MDKINHYKWLQKNLSIFKKNLIDSNDQLKCCHFEQSYNEGLISAHGDKCSGPRNENIPFPHFVAIYLLTYVKPYSEQVRKTKDGWVDPFVWVTNIYPEMKKHLPEIILSKEWESLF